MIAFFHVMPFQLLQVPASKFLVGLSTEHKELSELPALNRLRKRVPL